MTAHKLKNISTDKFVPRFTQPYTMIFTSFGPKKHIYAHCPYVKVFTSTHEGTILTGTSMYMGVIAYALRTNCVRVRGFYRQIYGTFNTNKKRVMYIHLDSKNESQQLKAASKCGTRARFHVSAFIHLQNANVCVYTILLCFLVYTLRLNAICYAMISFKNSLSCSF